MPKAANRPAPANAPATRAESVVVRVRKPYVRPAGLEVEFSAVTVARP